MGRGKVVFTRTRLLEALQLKEGMALEQIGAGDGGELILVVSGPKLPEVTNRGSVPQIRFHEVSDTSNFIKE